MHQSSGGWYKPKKKKKSLMLSWLHEIVYFHYIAFFNVKMLGFMLLDLLGFCVVFCRSLFVLLFFWSLTLCCLFSFNLRILITPLVSSNSSYSTINTNMAYLRLTKNAKAKSTLFPPPIKMFIIINGFVQLYFRFTYN